MLGYGLDAYATPKREDDVGILNLLGDLVERRAEAFEELVHQRVVDRLLRIEVVVESAKAQVRGLRDLVDRNGLHATLGHQSKRRTEEPGPRSPPSSSAPGLWPRAGGRRG